MVSQLPHGEERLICYASQGFNKHEKNYNVTRKKLLAVITFVKKFRQYLLGWPFLMRTDHAALQWLKRTPEPIGQQARWLEILEEFDYTIQHRPGLKHNNADALSRRPAENSEVVMAATRVSQSQPTLPAERNELTTVQEFDWISIQKGDPDTSFVYNLVITGSPRPSPASLSSKSGEVKTLCSLPTRASCGERWYSMP